MFTDICVDKYIFSFLVPAYPSLTIQFNLNTVFLVRICVHNGLPTYIRDKTPHKHNGVVISEVPFRRKNDKNYSSLDKRNDVLIPFLVE